MLTFKCVERVVTWAARADVPDQNDRVYTHGTLYNVIFNRTAPRFAARLDWTGKIVSPTGL